MHLPAGQPLRHLVTRHLADGRPHALEERWLNMQALPETAGFEGLSVNEWLVANVPFQGGHLAFLAASADAQAAACLQVAEGTALMVDRADDLWPEAAITHVRLWHRPGYRVETTL